MDKDAYLDALREHGQALLDAARAADPNATIAACPGWRPIDLVWHIGEVQRFWGTVARDRLAAPPDWDPERPATDAAVYQYADESLRLLLEVFGSADPSESAWTWCDDEQNVGFIIRRMAQETAVHRTDAERAAGRDVRIDAELAADGIDEFLVRMLPDVRADAAPLNGSVHVHCTDTEGEWTVTPGDDGRPAVTVGHAKGDAAIRGPAHDLLMALWRRAGTEPLEVFGDERLVERFLAQTNNE